MTEKKDVLKSIHNLRSVHSSFIMLLPVLKKSIESGNQPDKEEMLEIIDNLEKKTETLKEEVTAIQNFHAI